MEKAKNSLEPKRCGLIRTFGRTHGKKLSARQTWLVDNILPALNPLRESLTKNPQSAILEIGFGTGEHLVELATQNPDKIIIGAEPFINGVASLLSKITDGAGAIKQEYENIRIWPDDIRNLISHITYHISHIYILHPDPWPKARHEKRRLLSADFLKTLSSFISRDGSIIIGTDHADYYDWILEQAKATGLKISDEKIDMIKTKYQEKNMFGGTGTMYLTLSGNAEQ
ncbi:MAG: tRNA (guanine(46)-N(7))-methyltransferase TrmB [Rickettsiales bacterium]|jgi:tRNA (guanine-N7-)-methyltransferase|nr:tRNA (guanine(46)-N(7))-methyltransferase TrmB [Rickettsiales bacterium]